MQLDNVLMLEYPKDVIMNKNTDDINIQYEY